MGRNQYPEVDTYADFVMARIFKSGSNHYHLKAPDFFYNRYDATINDPSGALIGFMPTSVKPHIALRAYVSSGTRLEMWENVTFTSTGGKVKGFQMDRNVAGSSTMIVYTGCKVYNTAQSGLKLFTAIPGVDRQVILERENDVVLKRNTNYLAWMRPTADGAKASIAFYWYEK